jgi:nickel-dependent lactate racemase
MREKIRMADKPLDPGMIEKRIQVALDQMDLDGRRVLVIVPDLTRKAPVGLIFRLIHEHLRSRVNALDVLIALGTHPPLTADQIAERVGVDPGKLNSRYPGIRFFNHDFQRREALISLGRFTAGEVEELTGGLLKQEVEVTVNRRVADYDHVLLLSPVVPHESMGFSGGYKMFFPGIAGQSFTALFHWLAAVITNPVINGVKENPVRRLIDRAARWIPAPSQAFCMVVGNEGLAGLFAGPVEQAWSQAADLSARLHIRTKSRPFSRVLGVAPGYYEDIWVAGKVMYKLEPVVADGGELIIYAPHITRFSVTHEEQIRQVGYHIRDYFLSDMERFASFSLYILAHSSNLRGIGSMEKGREKPRIKVVLATGIPERLCREVNLGYRDPRSLDLKEWEGKEEEGCLLVDPAGQELYRLKKDYPEQ